MRVTKIKRNSVWVKCLLTEKIYKVHCDRVKLANELSDAQHKVFPTEEIILDDAQLVLKPKEGYVSNPTLQDKETGTSDESSPKVSDEPENKIQEATTSIESTTSVQPRYSLRSRKGTVKSYDNVMSRPIEFRRNHLNPQAE